MLVLLVCGIGAFALKGLAPKPPASDSGSATVVKSDLRVQVVETGTLNANNVVELKSLVSGRLKTLYVEVGDKVKAGQLVAIIDPRETQLAVDQTRSQADGARSAVQRSQIEMEQRTLTARSDLASARARLTQSEEELKAQPELTRANIAQARTALATAQRERDRLLNSAEPSQRIAAQSSIDEAKSNVANAEAELNRDQALLGKGYVSKKQVEDAQLAVELAHTRLQTAKDNYDTIVAGFTQEIAKADQAIKQAQAGVDTAVANAIQDKIKRDAYRSAVADRDKAIVALRDVAAMKKGIDQNWATVRQLTAALADGERNLGETKILAPIDGLVTKKDIRVGELVTSISGFSSGSPIVRIEDRSAMKVQLDVNEIDAARMNIGMPVDVAIDALPDLPLHGTISKISPTSIALDNADINGQTASGTSTADTVVKYKVEVKLVNPPIAVRSGMSTKCTFILASEKNALNVPIEYVGHDAKGDYVNLDTGKKVQGKAVPERRTVVIGLKTATNIALRSGVKEGDKLLRPDYSGPKRQGAMMAGGGD
ncbi:MAG TPA: HlyD family efflux transporter periplasmic adaptor subunit [Fimbriimonadaceae bacterium]|nr:HlyD family efflux transporter periplasmic adaptor subunit [Fimbriimonadaceae bacterium]